MSVRVNIILIIGLILNINCSKPSDHELFPVDELHLEPFYVDSNNQSTYVLSNPREIQIDKAGNVYVLESLMGHISKFNPNGEFIKYIGRRGEGPGEFGGPVGMRIQKLVNGKEKIFIHDAVLRRISLFNTDGSFVHSFTYWGPPAAMAIDGQGRIALLQPEMNKSLIFLYNRDGERVDSMGTTKPIATEWHPDPTPQSTEVLNYGKIKYNTNNELLVLYGNRHAIEIYSNDGGLIMESVIEGDEITALHNTLRKRIKNYEKQYGQTTGEQVITISFFSDFEFLDNDMVLINVARHNVLYQFDIVHGKLERKYRLIPPQPNSPEDIWIRGITVNNNSEFFGVDYNNLIIWKGTLK